MKTNRLTKYFASAPALAVVFGLAGGSAIAQESASPLTALDDARSGLVEKLMPQTALISHSPKKTPGSPQPEGESGLGSGYIVDAQNCLVVTNNHVGGLAAVDADITIVLSGDPKKEYKASVVGYDTQTDLSVLKTECDQPLPQEWQVTFGDSDKVRLGDHVIAIGNPFGLARTVTYGGISALHRNIRSGDFDDFIQIDAPINRGNSGGPTFNTKGEFIAMNTAIFSPSGGSAGIGFAIPSNMVKIVSEAIINNPDHKMHYAILGANVGVVDKDVAQKAGLDSPKGVMIAGIRPDSPAARAGLKKGDIILSLNGKPVEGEVAEDVQRFSSSIAFMKAGDQVAIEYFRDRQTHQMTATLGQRPDRVAVTKEDTAGEDGPAFQPGFLESIPDESFSGFVEQFEMGMGLMQQQIDRLQSQADKLKSKKEQGMAALKQEMERRGITPPPFLTPDGPATPPAAPEQHQHMPGMPMPGTP